MDLAARPFLVLALACSAPTYAAAPPKQDTVAVQLVALQVDETQTQSLRTLIDLELLRHGLAPAKSDAVDAFLKQQPDDTCISEYPTCLPALAKASGAGSALLFTVAPYGPHILITSKWMGGNGKLIYDIAHRDFQNEKSTRSNGGVKKAVVAALDEVLGADRSVANTPEVVPLPTPPVPSPPVSTARAPSDAVSPLRWVGVGVGVVGVASLVTAGVVALTSRSDQTRLREHTDTNSSVEPGSADNLSLARSLNQRSRVVTATLITGAVLTASGVALSILAPAHANAASVKLTAEVGPGRGDLLVRGTF